MTVHVTLKSACLWLLFILHSVGASQIASFINEHYNAPQVIRYDLDTKLIMYSLCNSNSTPVFPANSSAAFDTRPYTPIAGTHISLTGYLDEESGKILEEEGNIVEEIFDCDLSSGLYVPQAGQQYRINDKDHPPRNQTDLSALLLGKNGGYQVFYEDADENISGLRYKPGERDGWSYSGLVNTLLHKNNSFSAGFAHTDNIHVVSCGTQENAFIEVASQQTDKVWEIQDDNGHTVYPITNNTTGNGGYTIVSNGTADTFNFPSFNESKAQLAVAFGFKEGLSLFYIGEDRMVYQVAFSDGRWEVPTVKQASIWPPPHAEESSADISVTYDYRTSRMWLYYMSNGTLTQVYKPEQDHWHAAVALPTFNATDDVAVGGDSGLSSGAKIGMGVSLGVGVPLLLTAIAGYFFHLRRSRRAREGEAVAGQAAHAGANNQPPHSQPGSPAPHYTSGYWSNGQWVPGAYAPPSSQAFTYGNKPEEVGWAQNRGQLGHQDARYQSDPIFELPHTNEPQEMMANEVQFNPKSPSSAPRG